MSNLQPNCCLEFDFQKVDQHAGGKWLIHDTKRRKDNQLQSLKLPCRISWATATYFLLSTIQGNKENKQVPHYLLLGEDSFWALDTPHKEPVTRKIFTCFMVITFTTIQNDIATCVASFMEFNCYSNQPTALLLLIY